MTRKIKISKRQWDDLRKSAQSSQEVSQSNVQNAGLNKRQEAMLEWYNLCLKQNVAITQEGYNSVGRSNGIVRAIAGNPNAFYTFMMRQKDTAPVKIVENFFARISK